MKDSNTKVSIIIPVYNAEKFIKDCINSITNQTYKNIEIIIINDGSTDNSEEICKEFQKKDNRIIYYYQKNNGVTKAREKGVSLSTGNWISFVDADDILVHDAIEYLIKNIQNNDIVIGNIQEFYHKSTITNPQKNDIITYTNYTKKQYIKLLLGRTKLKIHGPYAKIIKKALFDETIFMIPPQIKRGEDFIMNIKLAVKSNSILYISKNIYLYRQHNNSTIHTFQTNWKHESLFLQYLLKPLYDLGIKKDFQNEITLRKLLSVGEAFADNTFDKNDLYFLEIKNEANKQNLNLLETIILNLINYPPKIRYTLFRIARRIL